MAALGFEFSLRVYWEDTDAGGVVFHANYLKFFERARTEWLRTLGHSQQQWLTGTASAFVVTETSVHYRLPARLDDLIVVSTQVAERGRASLLLVQHAHRDNADGPLLAQGRIRIGFVEAGTFRPRRIPTDLLQAMA